MNLRQAMEMLIGDGYCPQNEADEGPLPANLTGSKGS
jgi:hypothetical protein